MSGILIETARFRLRPLTVDDASERYLGWFLKSGAERIKASASTRELDDLREYISAREGRPDILFLGIFEAVTGDHIGNIKYEPVDSERGYAVMGIFIGEIDWRGTGVAGEVLSATASWLAANRAIRQILLGVEKDNIAAIRAYEKLGFQIASTPLLQPAPDCHTMMRDLST